MGGVSHPQQYPMTLRRRLRTLRCGISPREQLRHARAVALQLAKNTLVHRAERIAFYWPTDGELDPRPFMRHARRQGKICYLPALRTKGLPRRQGRLWFVRHEPGARLQPNRFGIPEPASGRPQPPRRLDLLLVPLVGFDADCNRIGMGGGFYDRTLAHLRPARRWRRPRLIGLAHACQRLDHISPQPWDIPLDAVVTEQGLYRRRHAGAYQGTTTH